MSIIIHPENSTEIQGETLKLVFYQAHDNGDYGFDDGGGDDNGVWRRRTGRRPGTTT